jgi:hypothetical protein
MTSVNMHKQMALYNKLYAQSLRLRSVVNARRIQYLLDESADNAALTIYTERAAAPDQWHRIFVGSLESLLCTNDEPKAVIAWFARRDITTFNA